ncbi:MAG: MarR family transcriptional regulator [Solirubrobacteraceae bacterium]|jgi:DNA-binding MarR family transcriptional regulator
MPAAPIRYAESLSFLLSQIGAESARLFAGQLAPLGLSPRAFGVLSNLAVAEGQTQQQLADALGMHRNNMVGLIDELEAAGWLQRRRGVTDRRAFHLHLTRAGQTLVDRANALIPALDARLGQSLPAADRRRLVSQLTAIARTLGLDPSVHPHLAARPR